MPSAARIGARGASSTWLSRCSPRCRPGKTRLGSQATPPSEKGIRRRPTTLPKATVTASMLTGTIALLFTVSMSSGASGSTARSVAVSAASRYAMVKSASLRDRREAIFSSRYIAAKSSCAHASVNCLAASFCGDPGTPATAPRANAVTARIVRGSVRVTKRRRRSTSGGRLFTCGKVAVRVLSRCKGPC